MKADQIRDGKIKPILRHNLHWVMWVFWFIHCVFQQSKNICALIAFSFYLLDRSLGCNIYAFQSFNHLNKNFPWLMKASKSNTRPHLMHVMWFFIIRPIFREKQILRDMVTFWTKMSPPVLALISTCPFTLLETLNNVFKAINFGKVKIDLFGAKWLTQCAPTLSGYLKLQVNLNKKMYRLFLAPGLTQIL